MSLTTTTTRDTSTLYIEDDTPAYVEVDGYYTITITPSACTTSLKRGLNGADTTFTVSNEEPGTIELEGAFNRQDGDPWHQNRIDTAKKNRTPIKLKLDTFADTTKTVPALYTAEYTCYVTNVTSTLGAEEMQISVSLAVTDITDSTPVQP